VVVTFRGDYFLDEYVLLTYLSVLKVKRKTLTAQIGHLEKRLRNGWRKRQVTLVISHKARP
jgi:hypothetical protein